MSQSPLPPSFAVLTDKLQPRRTFLQTLSTGALLAVVVPASGRADSSPSPSEPASAPDLAEAIESPYYADPGWSS